MIILLQSVTMQFSRLFSHISYDKVRQVILLQSVADCYYKVHQVLQSVTDCKVRQILQSVADFITKCDSYYKLRRNTFSKLLMSRGLD